MRRDCMKCEYCWHSEGIPDGCGYKLDGSMAGLRLTQTGNKLILTIVEAAVSDQNKKTQYN